MKLTVKQQIILAAIGWPVGTLGMLFIVYGGDKWPWLFSGLAMAFLGVVYLITIFTAKTIYVDKKKDDKEPK